MSNEFDQMNADWGNLDLRDTQDLNEVLDILEGGDYERAKILLDDFIARRGYDENAGDWCERCRALIEGGNLFSRRCDNCLEVA